MIRVDHRSAGVLAAILIFSANSWGQSDDQRGVPAQAPRRMNQLGGVRSAAPRPMSGLGGVKSQPGVRSQAPGVRSLAPRGYSTPLLLDRSPTKTFRTLPQVGGAGIVSTTGGYTIAPVIRDSNGFSISGSYHDGPFTLNFHTGSLDSVYLPGHQCIVPVYTGGYAAGIPCGVVGTYFSDGSYFSSGYYTSYASSSPAPSAPKEPEPAPVVQTPSEQAAAAMKLGDFKTAIDVYTDVLKTSPNDAEAMRALGLAYIGSGRVDDGVAMVGMAYRADASLPMVAVSSDVYGTGERLKGQLSKVSLFANRVDSASAWVTVAILMQADGRGGRATEIISRAVKVGLNQETANDLVAAFRKSSRK